MNPPTIGMLGIGLLGSALAERFVQAGYAVVGYDVDPQRRKWLAAQGGAAAASSADVAGAPRLVLSLPDTPIVEAVLEELGSVLQPGQLLFDTTTGDPDRTAALGQALAARGLRYLDATILGSSEHVRAGDVLVMLGGDAADVAACQDLLAAFARQSLHVGGWGAGARMKLVVNLVLGLNRAVLAEGLAFARSCGIDPAQALDVLRSGLAYSRVMDAKGPKMIHEDFTPQARLAQHLKDVRLILTQGERVGARLPLSTLHRELLERVAALGYSDADNAAIIKAFS